jgi:hypothetical protein
LGHGSVQGEWVGGSVPTTLGARGVWPGAELIIVEASGHTGSTTITEQVHAAADRIYDQITNPS